MWKLQDLEIGVGLVIVIRAGQVNNNQSVGAPRCVSRGVAKAHLLASVHEDPQ